MPRQSKEYRLFVLAKNPEDNISTAEGIFTHVYTPMHELVGYLY